jgi:hypothetical protein
MGRQRTPQVSALLALGVHAIVVACSGLVFLVAFRYGKVYAPAGFLVLDAVAVAVYMVTLAKAEGLAQSKRETMFEALCRE